nr:class I SAM-dependent methyltransferase [uncultured Dyadobacter sp.]
MTNGSSYKEGLRNWYYDLHIPEKLSRNFISLPADKTALLAESLMANVYSSNKAADSVEVQQQSREMEVRLRNHRTRIIPWLNSVKPLKELRILEIGCGNGTSTVALAEQGAIVTAIDIENGLLKDAEERCRIYGLNATFHLMNATEVAASLSSEKYDIIMFFAVLEHMTYAERLAAISQTYHMLSPGGLWCVIGTPNRLHLYDSHTSLLPFYYWLPDELAIRYASRSPRGEFAARFDQDIEPTEEQKMEFARWGRGMSYHEFELAIGPLSELNIVGSLTGFLKKRDIVYRLASRYSSNGRYKSFLKRLNPNIHECFYDPFLDLIIRK